jgi:hypothetical protein
MRFLGRASIVTLGLFGAVALSTVWLLSTDGFVIRPTEPPLPATLRPHLDDKITINMAPELKEVPDRWRQPDIAFQFKPLRCDRLNEYYRMIITDELSKYNSEALWNFVGTINVVECIEFSNIAASGTAGERAVWVAISLPNGDMFNEDFVKFTVHFEIGTMIYYAMSNRISAEEWAPGVVYLGDPVEQISRGDASSAATCEMLSAGFLNGYARSAMDRDVGAVHAYLMKRPRSLTAFGEFSERINNKARQWQILLNELKIMR